MNIYVIVEGKSSEKIVYKSWIPFVNSRLKYVEYVNELANDNFTIISGGGYPNYINIIKNAITDVNENPLIDRLVIAVDSEDKTYSEKKNEIEDIMSNYKTIKPVYIIIQHFCFEAWVLGNKKLIGKNIKNELLREYIRFYNVKVEDPENMPDYPNEELNRAQFSKKYLRKLLNDKNGKLTYTESNPKALLHEKYFNQLEDRKLNDNHIASFADFLTAFV